ncbi:MAG: NAD(+) synthase [Clostridia bacterium]|nr:NAD(+) synthase [Clostridia bacterium]
MKHGFIKAAAAAPDLRVGDPAYNADKIIEAIRAQAAKGTEVLVFPELSLCGYTCGDLLLQPLLKEGCLNALKRIAEATQGIKMLVFVGLPFELRGGKVYNCAAAICDGEVKGIIPKSNIPNYREFYERRYFVPAPEEGEFVTLWEDESVYFGWDCIFTDEEHGVSVACEICEDLWVPQSPCSFLAPTKAQIVVNLSASNETVGKHDYRRTIVSAQSGKNICGYVYCNAGIGESTTDCVYAGNHMIYEDGSRLAEAQPFSGEPCEAEIDVGFLNYERSRNNAFHDGAGEEYSEIPVSFVGDGELSLRKVPRMPFVPSEADMGERGELIHSMKEHELARRLRHTGAKTAVIGVSGGLDSTLALLVTARAFELLNKPREDIIAVTMPGFGTTLKTKNNSLSLMQAMGATVKTVNIAQTVLKHFRDIGHDPEQLDATYENAQARYRTMVLMDIAGETGGLVIGTGDMSELALGWCTYNGDHMSMYGVNASIPKTLVKYLVSYEGKRLGGRMEVVLKSVVNTEISPELLPPDGEGNIAQKTEDIVGPYELHDFFLYRMLRCGDAPAKIYALARYAFGDDYSAATVKKWLKVFYKRFFSQQFKRSCSPDGVKVGSVSLSPRGDWRMPSDASAALWLEEVEKL